MRLTPLSRMVHGWHHQGFIDQKAGGSAALESADALESTGGVQIGEIVIATNQLPIDENLRERGHSAASLPALKVLIAVDGFNPVLNAERPQQPKCAGTPRTARKHGNFKVWFRQ